MNGYPNRRTLLRTAALLTAAGVSPQLLALSLTPPQTAGPFYPDQMPADDDADLTRVAGQPEDARGEITRLAGRVLDASGNPIRGARVEIWQCDAHGRYRHSRDRGPDPDFGFQGFGHAVTGEDGGYRFRTIRPVPYPGRTPHIHYHVVVPGEGRLVTQLYVEDEPRNAGDGLYRRLSEESRQTCTVPFTPADDGILDATFDVVLGLRNITPV